MRFWSRLATFDERAQSRPFAPVEQVETLAREDPVLAHERHDVRDGPERDHVEVLPRAVESAVSLQQSLDELERDAHAGE